MDATEQACLLKIAQFQESGLTYDQALRRLLDHSHHVFEVAERHGRYDLASVAWNRVAWVMGTMAEA